MHGEAGRGARASTIERTTCFPQPADANFVTAVEPAWWRRRSPRSLAESQRLEDFVKRVVDVIVAAVALGLLLLPLVAIALLVRLTSDGPVFYWSARVGRLNRIFRMPKFRTMRVDTPAVPSHLLTDARARFTPIGAFLRRTSLDELPQLWCILRGDMSLVGPRPALVNQDDLVTLRTAEGVHRLLPGVTGWAQINGRDQLTLIDKVRLDAEYLRQRSLWFDLRILTLTLPRVLRGDGVSH